MIIQLSLLHLAVIENQPKTFETLLNALQRYAYCIDIPSKMHVLNLSGLGGGGESNLSIRIENASHKKKLTIKMPWNFLISPHFHKSFHLRHFYQNIINKMWEFWDSEATQLPIKRPCLSFWINLPNHYFDTKFFKITFFVAIWHFFANFNLFVLTCTKSGYD